MARGFNGSSDSAVSTFTTAQKAITTCSIAWWENLTANGQYIRPYHWDTGGNDWRMEFDDSWGYVFVVGWSTAAGKWSIAKPSTGSYHHIAITYDGSSTANDPVIYLNGVSQTVTERAAPSGTIQLPTGTSYFGSENGSGQWFNGSLAEFAIWNTVLSGATITALAGGNAPSFYTSGLLLYAPLIGSASPEPESIEASNLTLTGTSQTTHPTITYPSAVNSNFFMFFN